MPVAKVGEISLCYKVSGEGQPLILITGFASAQNMWYAQVRAFSKSYRVVTFDNRGFGKSDKPPGPYTTKMMASDTIALMDCLGIEKAHIVAGSMGGHGRPGDCHRASREAGQADSVQHERGWAAPSGYALRPD